MKKSLKISLLAISSLFTLPMIVNSVKTISAEETGNIVNQEDMLKAQAASDYLNLNCDLDNVVNNIYLPEKGLYDSTITWESSNTNLISIYGYIARPKESEGPQECQLTANITVRTATVKKVFNCRVLPSKAYTAEVKTSLYEDFSSYKVGQDLSNYFIWDHSGDEIATTENTVQDNNLVKGKNVLDFKPLPTLYKDAHYTTDVSVTTKSVMEMYVMTTGTISGFRIELVNGGSKILSIGLDENRFTYLTRENGTNSNGEAVTVDKYNDSVQRDNGVWYRLRFEIDVEKNNYTCAYYDFKNNNQLVDITPKGGMTLYGNSPKKATGFRMRAITGRNDGHIYVSDVKLDEASKLPVTNEANPNRTIGIGEIQNYQEKYLLVEGQEFALPKFKIFNRFQKDQELVEGINYTVTQKPGENGLVNTKTPGEYSLETIITLTVDENTTETRILKQTFHVDPINGTADFTNTEGKSTLRICPLVNDLDPTAEKVLRIYADIDRIDSEVFYSAVEHQETKIELTPEEIVSGTNSNIVLHGSEVVTTDSFDIHVKGLDKTKEYDFYVVSKNKNGYSEIEFKERISINVYNIVDCDDFFFMCTDPNVQTTSFRLLNDLDFTGYEWLASEITRPEYTGIFDGQGFSLNNLKITDAPYKKASLFYDFAGTFKNVTFNNCELAGGQSVGWIGGYAFKQARVENVKMVNTVVRCCDSSVSYDGYYGLLFGRVEGGTKGGDVVVKNVEITNCRVEAPKYVGIICGNLQKVQSLTLENVYAQCTIKQENAASGLVSRVRNGTKLIVKDTIVDLTVEYAKKEVATICGHLEGNLEMDNVVGKLTIYNMTQPTYFNTVTGRYVVTASVKYNNAYFFVPDISQMSEDSITPVVASLHIGGYLNEPFEYDQKWWEENTGFDHLDTDPNWGYNEKEGHPYLRTLDLSTLSFTAEQVNHYIDLIGDVINSDDYYYIKKARELYAYVKESDKANVKINVLEAAEQNYAKYIESMNTALDNADDVYTAITGGLDWVFTPKEGN